MKKWIALALTAAALTVPVTQAGAASGPTAAQVKALQKQVATLQKQVKTMQKKLNDTSDLALAVGVYTVCLGAIAADTIQGTWQTLDQREQAQGRAPIFGTQTPISDANLCQQGFNVARSHANPPTTSVFVALNTAFGVTAFRYSALGLLLG
jgi:hypothetical protein